MYSWNALKLILLPSSIAIQCLIRKEYKKLCMLRVFFNFKTYLNVDGVILPYNKLKIWAPWPYVQRHVVPLMLLVFELYRSIELAIANNNNNSLVIRISITSNVERHICPLSLPLTWMINSFQKNEQKLFWYSRSLWTWPLT